MACFKTDNDLYHNESRKRVCVICYRKGNRHLSSNDVKSIQDFVIKDYDTENEDFPEAICNGCVLLLSKLRNGQRVNLPQPTDYDPQRTNLVLRGSKTCSCRICTIAHCDLQSAVKMKKKPGRPKSENATEVLPNMKICGNCFSQLYPGCSHSKEACKSKRIKVDNVSSLVDTPKKCTKEQVASRVLDEAGTTLTTLGRKKIVSSQARIESTQFLSAQNMCQIQNNLDLSDRQTLKLAQNVR